VKGKERKTLMKNIKHPIYPYPKEDVHSDQIEEVVVEKSEKNENSTRDQFFV